MSRTLTKTSPRELWVIEISESRWLPVYAYPCQDGHGQHFFHILPARYFDLDQATALVVKLEPLTRLAERRDQFLIEAARFPDVAMKVTGCMPDDYFRWGEQKPTETPETLEVEGVIADFEFQSDMLTVLAQSAQLTGQTVGTMKVFWRALNQVWQKRLMDERKPINLGFCKLVPVPYRANWKDILLTVDRYSWHWLFKQGENRRRGMEATAFRGMLNDPELAAYENATTPGRDRIVWHLEVLHDKNWHKAEAEHERENRKRRGQAGYLTYWLRCIETRLDLYLSLYADWRKAISQEVADYREGAVVGTQVFSRRVGNKQARGNSTTTSQRRIPVGPLPEFQIRKLSGGKEQVVPKDTQLPALPPVQPPEEDVRESGPLPILQISDSTGNGDVPKV